MLCYIIFLYLLYELCKNLTTGFTFMDNLCLGIFQNYNNKVKVLLLSLLKPM